MFHAMRYVDAGQHTAFWQLGIKTAATMAELRAAAARIPGVVRVTPDNPIIPGRIRRSLLASGFPFMSPMYFPPMTPRVRARLGRDWTRVEGKILTHPRGPLGAQDDFVGKIYSQMPEEVRAGAAAPVTPANRVNNADAVAILHEAMERRAVREGRKMPMLVTHKDLSVALADNNLLAGATGYGSKPFKDYYGTLREREGAVTRGLIKHFYGVDHVYGASKIPKAMRNDLLRKMESLSLPKQRALIKQLAATE